MNFLAHGLGSLGEPYLVAGTALPDWLRVADRRLRLRTARVQPLAHPPEHGDLARTANAATTETRTATGTETAIRLLARGALQHEDDDTRFHNAGVFCRRARTVARQLQQVAEGRTGRMKFAFAGHVATEMLLDAALIAEDPARLETYYADLAAIETSVVTEAVFRMTGQRPPRLAEWIDRFRQEQFLRDYTTPEGLLHRLNQVMRRVRLGRLPADCVDVLHSSGKLIAAEAGALANPPRPSAAAG